MKRYFSRLLSIVLVLCITLVGCSGSPGGLSGNYQNDTLAVLNGLRDSLTLADDAPDKMAAQAQARSLISDYISRYRRNESLTKLSSFTTMRTALNSLAGHYASYPNRPVPEKLKTRLEQEFKQVEVAIKRGA